MSGFSLGTRHVRVCVLGTLFFLILASRPVFTEGITLNAEFWVDIEGLPANDSKESTQRYSPPQALLDEASWVFSGIIDGFEFEWTPLDLTRKIEERFSLVPAGKIQRGDPRLKPGTLRQETGRLFAWIECRPGIAGSAMIESRGREPWLSAGARGSAPLGSGLDGRRAACEDAIREAIRALLRSQEPNKPRLVRGRLAFVSPPLAAIHGGRWIATVKLRVAVGELLKYGVY